MGPDEVRQRIAQFIVETFLWGRAEELPAGGVSLFESRVVNSTDMLELVDFLGTEFGIRVADADLVPDHFETLDGLVRYVTRQRAGSP